MSLTSRQAAAVRRAAERLSHTVGSCAEGHAPRRADCPFCADEEAYAALLSAFPRALAHFTPPPSHGA